MESNTFLFSALGFLVAYGLWITLFAHRMPAFRSEKFLSLPEMVRERRMRRARRAGTALAILSFAVIVVVGALESHLAKLQSKRAAAAQREDIHVGMH
jgi:hypothetical protein